MKSARKVIEKWCKKNGRKGNTLYNDRLPGKDYNELRSIKVVGKPLTKKEQKSLVKRLEKHGLDVLKVVPDTYPNFENRKYPWAGASRGFRVHVGDNR